MILVAVAVAGIVCGVLISVLMVRRRRPESLEANLRNFQRGLDALDPSKDPLRERSRAPKKRNDGS